MTKRYRISVLCPQLPAAHAEQSTEVGAGSASVAIARGVRRILKSVQFKGRRIKDLVIKVHFVGTAADHSAENELIARTERDAKKER